MPPRLPSPQPLSRYLSRDAALLGLSTLVAAASLALALPSAHAIYCDRLAPLSVLAVLAATLIALCFRALARGGPRPVLGVGLLLASVAIFAGAAFVVRYHRVCGQVQQQIRSLRQHS